MYVVHIETHGNGKIIKGQRCDKRKLHLDGSFSCLLSLKKGDWRLLETMKQLLAKLNIKKQTILFQGAKLWNSLPSSPASLCSLNSFKRNIIDFLLEKQTYAVRNTSIFIL